MLALHMSHSHHSGPRSPAEGTCYTELQAVDINSISSLITTSTNMCLPEPMGDSSCGSEYGYHHHHHHYPSESPSPHSPQSVYEDLHDIHHIILSKSSSRPPDDDDDDDDSSVVLDEKDLELLSKLSRTDVVEAPMDRRSECRLIDPAGSPNTLYMHTALSPYPHYISAPYRPSPWSHHAPSDVIRSHHSPLRSMYPPTPSPSPKLRKDNLLTCTATMSDQEEDEDEDDDDEYKPYCDSRRGAKKNLLWKFLLWVLENHTDLAQWTDVKRGVFKFVDTARISRMWGQRKHKKDMTFEKLSRGIRHYYKRGLMERLANTRLVYKFNWEKVPRKYRKA